MNNNTFYLTDSKREVYVRDLRTNETIACISIKDIGGDYDLRIFNGSRMRVSKKDFKAYMRAR